MGAIRLKAGVSNGSARHFFADREALACALFEQIHQERARRKLDILRTYQDDPHAGIVALLCGVIAFAIEHPPQARILRMLESMTWSEEVASGIVTWCVEQDDQVRRALTDLIKHGSDPGISVTALTLAIEGCANRLVAGVLDGALAADLDLAAVEIGRGLCEGFALSTAAPVHSRSTRKRTKPAEMPASPKGPDLFSNLGSVLARPAQG